MKVQGGWIKMNKAIRGGNGLFFVLVAVIRNQYTG